MTQARPHPAATAAGFDGATAVGPDTGDSLDEFKDLYNQQRAQHARLRHAQQFLTSPVFYDLRLPQMQASDPPQAVAARLRDVEYRIAVLESLLSMMLEERGLLDRTHPAQPEPGPEHPEDADAEHPEDADAEHPEDADA